MAIEKRNMREKEKKVERGYNILRNEFINVKHSNIFQCTPLDNG